MDVTPVIEGFESHVFQLERKVETEQTECPINFVFKEEPKDRAVKDELEPETRPSGYPINVSKKEAKERALKLEFKVECKTEYTGEIHSALVGPHCQSLASFLTRIQQTEGVKLFIDPEVEEEGPAILSQVANSDPVSSKLTWVCID